MSDTVLTTVTRITETTGEAKILHGEPGLLKTMTSQLKGFVYNLYPANWFTEFSDIKITMEEFSAEKSKHRQS